MVNQRHFMVDGQIGKQEDVYSSASNSLEEKRSFASSGSDT